MKVEQFYSKNQFRLYGEGKEILQSYNSKVVEINYTGTIILGRDWDYSTTTSKYVYMFLEEYGNINFDKVNNKRNYIKSLISQNKIAFDKEMF